MKVFRENGTIIFAPHGSVCEYNHEAQDELWSLIYEMAMLHKQPEIKVLIDLSEVTFMNSSGLGQLMRAYLTTQMRGGQFAVCGANARVKRIIELVKLDLILTSYPNRADALAAFDQPEV